MGTRVTALEAGDLGFAVAEGETWYESMVLAGVVVDRAGQRR